MHLIKGQAQGFVSETPSHLSRDKHVPSTILGLITFAATIADLYVQ